jgi:hypothetical protein
VAVSWLHLWQAVRKDDLKEAVSEQTAITSRTAQHTQLSKSASEVGKVDTAEVSSGATGADG